MKSSRKVQLEEQLDLTFIGVVLGIILVLIGLLIFLRRRKRSQSVLLLGCSNGGKTVIFSFLIYDKIVATYTSMKQNIGLYKRKKVSLQLIDIPGHERLRQSLIDQYKSDVRGIIFVIDSKTIQSEIRDVAELLYGLLTDPVICSNCRRMLIVCNKQDLPEAKGPVVIQMLLEKELNVLRGLKTKQLDSTSDESEKKSVYLGSPKKDFEFCHLMSTNITFAESSALSDNKSGPRVEEIEEWLSNC